MRELQYWHDHRCNYSRHCIVQLPQHGLLQLISVELSCLLNPFFYLRFDSRGLTWQLQSQPKVQAAMTYSITTCLQRC